MPITDTLGVDEQRLQVMDAPHLTAFEAPADLSRQGRGDDPERRARLRTSVFHDNVMSHWRKATRDVPQDLKPSEATPQTRNTWLGERGK